MGLQDFGPAVFKMNAKDEVGQAKFEEQQALKASLVSDFGPGVLAKPFCELCGKRASECRGHSADDASSLAA